MSQQSKQLRIYECPNYEYLFLHRMYHDLPKAQQLPFDRFGVVITRVPSDSPEMRQKEFIALYREALIKAGRGDEVVKLDKDLFAIKRYFDQTRLNFFNAIAEMERHFNAVVGASTNEEFHNAVHGFAASGEIVGYGLNFPRPQDAKE